MSPADGPGISGDPTVASRGTGEKVIAAVTDDLARLIVEMVKSEGGDIRGKLLESPEPE
jgi:creatinine amidohydrolase/Fe(II)-dependent formamide hydrolase-like protein